MHKESFTVVTSSKNWGSSNPDMDQELKNILESATPYISVIVPLFNKAPYLKEAIESVIGQGYPNLEILIRNDGSSDDSSTVMNQLPSLYPTVQIRTFDGPNMGASACRNFLIERASGRLILLMDADDVMVNGFIHDAVSAMRENQARLVYSNVELFGTLDKNYSQESFEAWCKQGFDAYAIRYSNCLTSLTLLDKNIWTEIGGYEDALPFNEDWSFFIRATKVTHAFHKLPKVYFKYRQTTSGLYHTFIQNNWGINLAMVMLASPELYSVEEVMQATQTLSTMPENWVKKLEESVSKHSGRALAWLNLALARKSVNDTQSYNTAIQKSLEISGLQNWVALVLFGETLESADPSQALTCYHMARTQRPDASRIVNDRIHRLVAKNQEVLRPKA